MKQRRGRGERIADRSRGEEEGKAQPWVGGGGDVDGGGGVFCFVFLFLFSSIYCNSRLERNYQDVNCSSPWGSSCFFKKGYGCLEAEIEIQTPKDTLYPGIIRKKNLEKYKISVISSHIYKIQPLCKSL